MEKLPPIKLTSAVIFLIAVNLIPVLGVLTLGWDMATIIFLYWLETVIIGLVNVPKMWMCSGPAGLKIFLTFFFGFHFGMFSGGHFMFLYDMFGIKDILENLDINNAIVWTAASLLISHIFSMVVNFIGKKEYQDREAGVQMFFPYGRIVVMHIVIIFGGAVTLFLGSPIFALIILIGLKIVMDIIAHSFEHGGRPMHMLDKTV